MAVFATSELGFIIGGPPSVSKGRKPPGFGIGLSPESEGGLLWRSKRGVPHD